MMPVTFKFKQSKWPDKKLLTKYYSKFKINGDRSASSISL